MPKFIVGIIATTETEVEADTQEEAEAIALADPLLLCSAEWSIDYCEKLDKDDEDDDEDEESIDVLNRIRVAHGLEPIELEYNPWD